MPAANACSSRAGSFSSGRVATEARGLGPHRDAGLTPGPRTAIVSFFSAKGEHEATLCPPLEATVGYMKRRLAELLGVPAESLRVLHGLRAAADGESLLALGMPTELTLARAELETREPGTSLLHVLVDGDEQKLAALVRLLEALPDAQLVVYCNDRPRVLRLARQLCEAGHAAAALHGDLSASDRERTVQGFQEGTVQLLVLTDAAAPRFLGDMRPAPLVVNFDLPSNLEDFGRRVFRSGDFGRRAVSVSCVQRGEEARLRDAERFFAVRIPELSLDDCEEIAERIALSGRLVPECHAERFHRTELREQKWTF